ncbi:MAG: hypothetical protein NVSMB51_21520 [Solirubrobacteraceae bacterium]
MGLAAAAGLRPFLPALLAGALASGKVVLDFEHTDYSFLQGGFFLLVVVVVLAASFLLQRRIGPERLEGGPAGAAIAGAGLGVGAVLFAAVMAQHHDSAVAGMLAGLLCAGVAQVAVRGLLARTRGRLPDSRAREALAVYVDGVALALAALAVFVPPVSLLALLFLLRLLLAGRRRDGEKYAGLRILR